MVLVGDLPDLLAHPVVSWHAHAGVGVPVIERIGGAFDAGSADPDVAHLAEAAMLEEVLVSAAFWGREGVAAEGVGVIDLVEGALPTLDCGDVGDRVGD